MADFLTAYSLVVGAVGGTVALLLGAIHLRERLGGADLDIRWKWRTNEGGAISWAGLYFINTGQRRIIMDHVAFRWRRGEDGDWHFVRPHADFEEHLPLALAPGDYSPTFGINITDEVFDRNDLVELFMSDHTAVAFVQTDDQTFEFTIPVQEMRQPQESIRYEM